MFKCFFDLDDLKYSKVNINSGALVASVNSAETYSASGDIVFMLNGSRVFSLSYFNVKSFQYADDVLYFII